MPELVELEPIDGYIRRLPRLKDDALGSLIRPACGLLTTEASSPVIGDCVAFSSGCVVGATSLGTLFWCWHTRLKTATLRLKRVGYGRRDALRRACLELLRDTGEGQHGHHIEGQALVNL